MSDITDREVLVVDDEEVVLGAVSRILTASGIPFRSAQSAEEALLKIDQGRPALLLADIKLPGMSGLDLVRICADRFPTMVAVCMTGYANAEHVLLSLESGAIDFVPKPFTVDELLSTLMRAGGLVGRTVESAPPAGCHLLDGHSWMRPEDDGTLTLGVMKEFANTVGPIQRVEVPAPNTMLRQGGVLTRVMSEDGGIHRVWSAAGGRVEQANMRLEAEPRWVVDAPYGDGWVASVMPTSLDEEIARLSGC